MTSTVLELGTLETPQEDDGESYILWHLSCTCSEFRSLCGMELDGGTLGGTISPDDSECVVCESLWPPDTPYEETDPHVPGCSRGMNR